MTVIRLNIVSRVRLVHGRGFCGTERDGGHGWYTGRDSEVRNGMEGTVGTQEGLLRYGTGWRDTVGTREGIPRYGTGWRGMVGTPQWVLVYEMYGKKDLYTR